MERIKLTREMAQLRQCPNGDLCHADQCMAWVWETKQVILGREQGLNSTIQTTEKTGRGFCGLVKL